ncbi:hypothetical protein ACIBCC_03755 [Streptomyces griseus]|uniref:hypothetical protein n=1 Tax=Streptomyces TaxID=1883 RepID=UPI0001C19C4D|nr:hypothetical protein [Streptomyces sp. ACT-1]EGE42028.1 hypothetical protein SACT1_2683 [Streptomyces sp. ACT-1]MYR50079.1 hypothetical protein [Streptomyces sp. SID4928]
MTNEKATISKVFGILILAMTALMVISVVVMLATGAKFVPIMAAPVVFLIIGALMYRSGRRRSA